MKNLAKAITWIGMVVFFSGLFLFIYLGVYNRFWADDWCYNADLTTLGFWGTIKGYTFITHYASNRYSLTIFTGLMQFLGVLSVKMTAFLVVTGWFGGLLLTLHGINRFFKLKFPALVIFLVTAVLEYYSLVLAPNQFQILYWRAGVLPYSAPLIFSLIIFGLLLWQMQREKPSRALPFVIAPLSFIAGGFSEGGCAYLVTALGILFLVVIIYSKKSSGWAKRLIIPVSTALFFSLLALLVLMLSPANALRSVGYYLAPASPLLVPVLSIVFTIDFIVSSLKGMVLPYSMLCLLFFLIPFLVSFSGSRNNFSLSKNIKAMLIIAAVSILLIAASQAPTVYFENGPPAPRGLIFARFTLNFAFAAIFWLLGNLFVPRIKANYAAVMVLIILVPFFYTIRPLLTTYAELPRFIERAAVWDQRDASIRTARAQNILQIDVKGIDSKYIGSTRDLKENSNFWINACAGKYYGMQEIRATLPP